MKKVLIVDDTQTRHDWFRSVLDPAIYSIESAMCGEEALPKFVEQYDLVLCDHDMGTPLDGSRLMNTVFYDPEQYKAPRAVWIQSSNPGGAQNIQAKCDSAQVPCIHVSFENFCKNPDEFKSAVKTILESLDAEPA